MKRKGLAEAALAVALVCAMAVPARAAEYSDARSHYARGAVETWSGYGVLEGYLDGTFRPDGKITRAEMAAVVDRLMGYQSTVPNSFVDMPSDQWYVRYVIHLAAEGILQGNPDKTMRPDEPITRQEAFVILARGLSMEESGEATGFSDDATIADWARGYVSAMKQAGYIQGDQRGAIRADEPITRAEVVTILDHMVSGYVNKDGTYSENCGGNLVVNAHDVTLKDLTVEGDLIVADGVADGDVYLDHVEVEGDVILRGCGVNSFHIMPGSRVTRVIIDKSSVGRIRLANESGRTIPTVLVREAEGGVTLAGDSLGDVELLDNTSVFIESKEVKKLSVVGDAKVNVKKGSTVAKAEVDKNARNALLTINGTVTDLSNEARIKVSNKGMLGTVVTYSSSGSGSSENAGTGSGSGSTGAETPGTGSGSGSTGAETPGTGTGSGSTGAETPGTGTGSGSTGTETPGTGGGSTTPADPATCQHVWGEYTYIYHDCQSRTGERSCTLCGMKDPMQNVQIIHDAYWHDWETNDDAVAPTCTTPGLEPTKTCKRCGASSLYPGGLQIPSGERTEIPALGHSFGEWTIKVNATQDTPGILSRVCSRCGAEETKEIDAATCQHVWGEFVYTYGSDCQSRTGERNCTLCGLKDPSLNYEVIHDDAWHDWKTNDDEVAPTCTTPGLEATKTCTRCGKNILQTGSLGGSYQRQEIPALGHSGEWVVTTPATDTTDGLRTRTCPVCGEVETETIPAGTN